VPAPGFALSSVESKMFNT